MARAPTALPKEQTGFQKQMSGLMENPDFQAFMLNLAANIAAGNDVGTAAARGAEGVGRSRIAHRQMRREDEADAERKAAATAKRAGGRGRGGGLGGSAGAGFGLPKDIKRKDLVGMFDDQFELLQTSELADTMSRDELKGLAWIETLASAGQGAPAEILAQLQEPSQRSQFLADFSFGPETGFRRMQETAAAGQAELDLINNTAQPPVNPQAPSGLGNNPGPTAVPPSAPQPDFALPNPVPSVPVSPFADPLANTRTNQGPVADVVPPSQTMGVVPSRGGPSLGELLMQGLTGAGPIRNPNSGSLRN